MTEQEARKREGAQGGKGKEVGDGEMHAMRPGERRGDERGNGITRIPPIGGDAGPPTFGDPSAGFHARRGRAGAEQAPIEIDAGKVDLCTKMVSGRLRKSVLVLFLTHSLLDYHSLAYTASFSAKRTKSIHGSVERRPGRISPGGQPILARPSPPLACCIANGLHRQMSSWKREYRTSQRDM